MKTRPKRERSTCGIYCLLPLAAAIGACATTSRYVSKNIDNQVVLKPSASHDFEYVRVDQSGTELTVYGKVLHQHSSCESEGHVDVAVRDDSDQNAVAESIPIVRGPSKKPGWYGAAFRARLPVVISETARIVLAFHDPKCITGPTFDCGSNVAKKAAPVPDVAASEERIDGPVR